MVLLWPSALKDLSGTFIFKSVALLAFQLLEMKINWFAVLAHIIIKCPVPHLQCVSLKSYGT